MFLWFHNETVEHFFVECPLHSASRTNLLSSAARIFTDKWFSVKAQILSVSLFGSPLLSRSKIMIFFFMFSHLYLNRNNDLCFHVQSFIS